jgi:hypothetical protein
VSEWLSGHFAVGEEYDIVNSGVRGRPARERVSRVSQFRKFRGQNELQLISYTKIYALKL